MAEKLAVDGGKPVRTDPWPRRRHVGEEELQAALGVMRSSIDDPGRLWRRGGLRVGEFEAEFAGFHGVKYAAASSTGTAAIHLALAGAMLEPGGEVITSPITDVGTVTPILFQQLTPVFADVDPETLVMDPSSVEERVTEKTRAIIPVHLAGFLCDMERIKGVADEHGLLVMEDCAQAHAAVYKGRLAGSVGDVGCFSLMAGKHITSGGEGGMTITNDENLWRRAMIFSRSIFNPQPKVSGFDVPYPVLNYRMTELQAAIGLAQLKKLPSIVSRRRELYAALLKAVSRLRTVRVPRPPAGTEPSHWFAIIHLDRSSVKVSVDEFAEALRREGIPVGARYTGAPMYEYEFLAKMGLGWKTCPRAEEALAGVMTLGLHESCTEREVSDVTAALEKVEAWYGR